MGIKFRHGKTVIHPRRKAMKKILIVLFGVLAFQVYVLAESWEERAERKPIGVLAVVNWQQ